MEYPTSRHDVYHVAFLLRQKLVADLVPIILDEAQYWTRRRVSLSKGSLHVVSEAPEGKRLLRTAPLTPEEHRRVRLVRFTTRSVAQCFDRSVWDRPQSPSCGSLCGGSASLQHFKDILTTGTEADDYLGGGSAAAAATTTITGENTSSDSGSNSGDETDDNNDAASIISTTPSSFSSSSSSAAVAAVAPSSAGLTKQQLKRLNDENAFTWFEAHVAVADTPAHLYPDTTSRFPDALRAGAPRAPDQAPWAGPRVLANCNSEEELCRYEAEWRFDSADREERSRVRSIAAGEVIDFTAHCSVFGWENYIKEAEIEVFFGHIR